jgi:hypothetical protein
MHEWESLVRQALAAARISPARLDEIAAEIAAHLDQLWQEQAPSSANTMTPQAFLRSQLGDIAQFRSRIERAENPDGTMMERSRHFWMPAFVALALIETVYWSIWAMRVVHWTPGGLYLMRPFGVDFLISLVLVGGLAALLVRRSGGTRLCAVLAGVVPALARYGPAAIAGSFVVHATQRPPAVLLYSGILPIACLAVGALLCSLVPRVEHSAR